MTEEQDKDETYHMDETALSGNVTSEPNSASFNNTPSLKDIGSSIVYQRTLFVVGTLLLTFALYKIMMWIVHWHQHQPAQTSAVTTASTPPRPQVPVAVTPPSETAQQEALQGKIKTLVTMQQAVHDHLQTFDNQINTIATQVQNIHDQLSALTTLIQNVNTETTARQQLFEAKIAQMLKPPRPSQPVVIKKPMISYVLQAVIPGRAWLIQKNGTGTVTVRVGSHVPGYGVVSRIDANGGRVVMASGKVITFSRDDH